MIQYGDIYYADLNPSVGSEQGGIRPVLVVQNNKGNLHSPSVIVVPITSKMQKTFLPTHVELPIEIGQLEKDSVVLTEQIRTIDKTRLNDKITSLTDTIMTKVDRAMKVALNMVNFD